MLFWLHNLRILWGCGKCCDHCRTFYHDSPSLYKIVLDCNIGYQPPCLPHFKLVEKNFLKSVATQKSTLTKSKKYIAYKNFTTFCQGDDQPESQYIKLMLHNLIKSMKDKNGCCSIELRIILSILCRCGVSNRGGRWVAGGDRLDWGGLYRW